jgi:hypothetical protein
MRKHPKRRGMHAPFLNSISRCIQFIEIYPSIEPSHTHHYHTKTPPLQPLYPNPRLDINFAPVLSGSWRRFYTSAEAQVVDKTVS